MPFAAFAIRGTSPKDIAPRADLERITLLARSIATYAADNNLDRLSMSTDRVVDYQNVGTLKLASIELLHRSLDVDGLLGHGTYGIFATSREDALRLLAESDVIVLTDPVTDRSHPYPMNTKIKEYWDELWQWTNENRVLLFSTEILGIPYRVFVRSLPWRKTSIGETIDRDARTVCIVLCNNAETRTPRPKSRRLRPVYRGRSRNSATGPFWLLCGPLL